MEKNIRVPTFGQLQWLLDGAIYAEWLKFQINYWQPPMFYVESRPVYRMFLPTEKGGVEGQYQTLLKGWEERDFELYEIRELLAPMMN